MLRTIVWIGVFGGIMMSAGTLPLSGQEIDVSDDSFVLGEIVVQAGRREVTPGTTTIDESNLETFDRTNVGRALDLLPGVSSMTTGARYEQRYFIRGFSQREVPLLINGIPVYTPYRGDVDTGRFTTFDLSNIEVTRGGSSVLHGPGALGGVVNVVTRRPEKASEGQFGYRLSLRDDLSTNGYESWFDQGGRIDSGWWKVAASTIDRSSFPLSSDFVPSTLLNAERPLEDGGDRLSSNSRDWRLHLQRGWQTERGDEWSINVQRQRASKGNPPYGGSDPSARVRYWEWPQYDKESIYVLGRRHFDGGGSLISRLYYDAYNNLLTQFSDADYDTVQFNSRYDEHAYGASFQWGLPPTESGVTTWAFHYKRDVHRGDDPDNPLDPGEHFEDATHSIGIERQQYPSERLTMTYGVSLDGRNPQSAWATQGGTVETYPLQSDTAWNPMVTARWKLSRNRSYHLGISRKTLFPTMFDRYSYRMERALPNPSLAPERAVHYETGWTWGKPDGRSSVEATLFWSDVSDFIEDVAVAPGVTQKQNVGQVDRKGFELAWEHQITEARRYGLSYGYLSQDATGAGGQTLQGLPRHSVFAWHEQHHGTSLRSVLSAAWEGSRLRSLDAEPATAVGRHLSIDVKLCWEGNEGATWELASTNLLDEDYELDPGWPEPGRQITLTWRKRW